MPKNVKAEQFRAIAARIRNNPHAREAIADGFELLADAMAPCEDCTSQQGAAVTVKARAKRPAAAKKAV